MDQTSQAQRKLSDKQWREDLKFMVSTMKAAHPNLYHDIAESRFAGEIEALDEAVPSLSDNEVLVGLLRLAALTRDWHTQVISRNVTGLWFPVRIEALQDGLFVTAAAPQHEALLGAKVVGVGDLPGDVAFSRVMEVTAHDNRYSQRHFATMLLSAASVLEGLHITGGDPEVLRLAVQPRGQPAGVAASPVEIPGQAFDSDDDFSWFWREETAPARGSVTVSSHPATPLPHCWRNARRPYWYAPLEPLKAVYLGFNLTVNDPEESFAAFCGRLWEEVDRLGVQHLLIDLRRNLGGDHDILAPLIDGVAGRSRLSRPGGLYVLIGPRNVSASAHCAAWLEQRARPIFAGGPTGARLNHYADPKQVGLPNSHLRLMVAGVFWRNEPQGDDRPCIYPHIPAEFDSTSYFGLRDPAMEKVCEVIKDG